MIKRVWDMTIKRLQRVEGEIYRLKRDLRRVKELMTSNMNKLYQKVKGVKDEVASCMEKRGVKAEIAFITERTDEIMKIMESREGKTKS